MAGAGTLQRHLGAGLLHRAEVVGKGFTTEALQAVVDFWFRQVGGAFLTCCHAVQNPASGRVMEKAGFVYHHNDVYHKFDGTPVECRCYLLTKERYDNRKDLL